MLTVKLITNPNDNTTDRTFNVIDFSDYRNLFTTLFDEFQNVLEQNKNEDKIELERVLDASDYDNADDLIDWIERMHEIESDLNSSNFDSIEDMQDRIEQLESAIDTIYNEAYDVRGW